MTGRNRERHVENAAAAASEVSWEQADGNSSHCNVAEEEVDGPSSGHSCVRVVTLDNVSMRPLKDGRGRGLTNGS